jgi:hypothetical protein
MNRVPRASGRGLGAKGEAVFCDEVNSIGPIESPNPAPAPERPIRAAAVRCYR